MPHPVPGWVVLGPSGAENWAARPGLRARGGGQSRSPGEGPMIGVEGEDGQTAQDRQKCWQVGSCEVHVS